MGVEAATYVTDFDTSLPAAADLVSQGDDHLRLIKTVLKNTFTGANRAFQIPTTLAKVANYTIVKADGESTIFVSTAGGNVTLTLPALVAGDAGWKIHFIKTNSGANPIFVVPPAGTLSSGGIALTSARRAIPGVRITVIWDGTGYFVTRALGQPIGSMMDYFSSVLPAGFEWPNGQTLASVATNYPEYNSVNGGGGTLDFRGRVGITLDNLGGAAAGRLAGGIITGTAVGNTGGSDTRTLVTGNLPAYTPAGTLGSLASSSADVIQVNGGGNASSNLNGASAPVGWNSVPTQKTIGAALAGTLTGAFTGTAQGGTSTAFGILQPSIMCARLLVVE